MKLTDHIPVEGRMRHKQSLFPTNRFLEYFESHQSSTGRKNLSSITIRVAEKKKKELQGSSSWIRLYTWKVLFESEKHEKINLTTTKAEFQPCKFWSFQYQNLWTTKYQATNLITTTARKQDETITNSIDILIKISDVSEPLLDFL